MRDRGTDDQARGQGVGYDSCPMIGFMIAVGKAVKPAMPKGGQLAVSEVAPGAIAMGLGGSMAGRTDIDLRF